MRAIATRFFRFVAKQRWDIAAVLGTVAIVVGLWWERPSVAMAVGGTVVVVFAVWRDWANGRKRK